MKIVAITHSYLTGEQLLPGRLLANYKIQDQPISWRLQECLGVSVVEVCRSIKLIKQWESLHLVHVVANNELIKSFPEITKLDSSHLSLRCKYSDIQSVAVYQIHYLKIIINIKRFDCKCNIYWLNTKKMVRNIHKIPMK